MSIQLTLSGVAASHGPNTFGGGVFPRTIDVSSGTTLTVTGMAASTAYGFTVQAYNATLTSPASNMTLASTSA